MLKLVSIHCLPILQDKHNIVQDEIISKMAAGLIQAKLIHRQQYNKHRR